MRAGDDIDCLGHISQRRGREKKQQSSVDACRTLATRWEIASAALIHNGWRREELTRHWRKRKALRSDERLYSCWQLVADLEEWSIFHLNRWVKLCAGFDGWKTTLSLQCNSDVISWRLWTRRWERKEGVTRTPVEEGDDPREKTLPPLIDHRRRMHCFSPTVREKR